ncbi:hypothetical protein ECC02_004387 [Trypanosoma cruzi]|uniref:Uncharacterized protein n=1 Tax=Trypanosoma cruzi TaxID=5693 RepID=A0A7J6Y7D7_TRYCR|nr:hypothetical protein ECC02_004387 [Trypanosoma cruzi]
MHSAGVESCLASAYERRADAVLRLAEELECGSPSAGQCSSPHFFRALVTAYLVQNDAVNATWALQRWATGPAGAGEQEEEGGVRAMLERVARHCGRCAYGEAFREALGAVGGGTGRDVEHLERWLLDYLAARHVHQRRTFYGESGGMEKLAVGLGVTVADLEARLQRVREDELRHIGREVSGGPCEKTRETLCCMLQVGKAA